MGNMMLNHLGGGPGGIEHFFQQFTGPMTAWWKALGSPVLTPEVQKKLIDSVHAEVGSRTIEELEAERDEILLGLIELRTKVEKAPARARESGSHAPARRDGALPKLRQAQAMSNALQDLNDDPWKLLAADESGLPRPAAAPGAAKARRDRRRRFCRDRRRARACNDADAEVILIDRRNHHIFQPLLYQVATAVLAPSEIAAPIRQLEDEAEEPQRDAGRSHRHRPGRSHR